MLRYVNNTILVVFASWILSVIYISVFGEIVVNKSSKEEFIMLLLPLQLIITIRSIMNVRSKNKTPFQCGQEDSFFNRELTQE